MNNGTNNDTKFFLMSQSCRLYTVALFGQNIECNCCASLFYWAVVLLSYCNNHWFGTITRSAAGGRLLLQLYCWYTFLWPTHKLQPLTKIASLHLARLQFNAILAQFYRDSQHFKKLSLNISIKEETEHRAAHRQTMKQVRDSTGVAQQYFTYLIR